MMSVVHLRDVTWWRLLPGELPPGGIQESKLPSFTYTLSLPPPLLVCRGVHPVCPDYVRHGCGVTDQIRHGLWR